MYEYIHKHLNGKLKTYKSYWWTSIIIFQTKTPIAFTACAFFIFKTIVFQDLTIQPILEYTKLFHVYIFLSNLSISKYAIELENRCKTQLNISPECKDTNQSNGNVNPLWRV